MHSNNETATTYSINTLAPITTGPPGATMTATRERRHIQNSINRDGQWNYRNSSYRFRQQQKEHQQRHKNDLGPSVTTPAIIRSTNMSTLSPTRSIDIDDNKNNENNSGNNIIGNNHEGRKLQYQHRQQEDKPEPSRTPTAWSIQARQNCHYIQLLRRSASHHWHPATPQSVGQIIPWYIESWSIKW